MEVGAFEAIKYAFGFIAATISLLRQAKDLLPEGAEKEVVEQSLEKAERDSKLAEAQIAQALRYEICRCTFPPQIMLSQGYRENREHFQCPRCGNTWPPPGSGEIEVVKDLEAFGD